MPFEIPDASLWLSVPALALLGLCVGSFLNVVVHRLPVMMEREWWSDVAEYQLGDASAWSRAFGTALPRPEAVDHAATAIEAALGRLGPLSISRPRSRCPSCGHPIRWYENIPLVSWLSLRGRCSQCKARISLRYPLVELATAGLFAACAARFGAQPTTLVWCGAVALLIAAALIDLDTTLLPDDLTLPLVGMGIVAAAAGWTPVSVRDAAIGAVAGYGSLWLVGWLYKKLRGAVGMAEGDMKLLAGLGALLGWQQLPTIVLLSSAVGAVVGIGLVLFKGHRREVPIPFGPYLAGGGLAAMFWGAELTGMWWPTL
jgi:leader peptidase (prepilin peptidase) / N-methyltransferase